MPLAHGMKGRGAIIIVLSVLSLLNAATATAQLDLPPGVQAINEYNEQYAVEFLQNVSFPVVFLAGILSIISPCILPLIPAFFSYTFKEKRKITRMTLVFFVGFSAIFVSMGMAAAYLGQSMAMFQGGISYLVTISGLGLILFGLLAFFGKGFSSFIKRRVTAKDNTRGVLIMGIFFAAGWSACLGPIIGGILLIAAALGNIPYAAMLMFTYSLGIMTPLLIMSLFYDRFDLGRSRLLKGKAVRFSLLGRSFVTHTTEMVSGALLIGMGLIFILFGGTSVINTVSPIGSSLLFNELQRALIESPQISGIIGLAVLIPLLAGITFMIRKRAKGESG